MGIRLRPPVVALLLLAAAFVVDGLVPSRAWVPEWLRPWGFVVIVLAVALGIWALASFRRGGTTHEPYGTPTALVVTGPYRFTRNPMYVAVTSILVGIAWCVGTAPWWGVPVLFFLYVRFVNVPLEERRLEGLFGDAYRTYRGTVRRWL